MVSSVNNTSVEGAVNSLDAMQKSGMDKDAFFKLLVTELTYQNPMEPVDNKDFIAQLAQFSSLEEMQSMSKGFEDLAKNAQWTYTSGLIGKWISAAVGDDGAEIQGVVQAAVMQDGAPMLALEDGTIVDPNTLLAVKEN